MMQIAAQPVEVSAAGYFIMDKRQIPSVSIKNRFKNISFIKNSYNRNLYKGKSVLHFSRITCKINKLDTI